MDQAKVVSELISSVSAKHKLAGHDARDFRDNAYDLSRRPESADSIIGYFERMDAKAAAKHAKQLMALKDFQVQFTNLAKYGKRRPAVTISA